MKTTIVTLGVIMVSELVWCLVNECDGRKHVKNICKNLAYNCLQNLSFIKNLTYAMYTQRYAAYSVVKPRGL